MFYAVFDGSIQQILVSLDINIEQVRQIVGKTPCQVNDGIDTIDRGFDEFPVGKVTAAGFDFTRSELCKAFPVAIEYTYIMSE